MRNSSAAWLSSSTLSLDATNVVFALCIQTCHQFAFYYPACSRYSRILLSVRFWKAGHQTAWHCQKAKRAHLVPRVLPFQLPFCQPNLSNVCRRNLSKLIPLSPHLLTVSSDPRTRFIWNRSSRTVSALSGSQSKFEWVEKSNVSTSIFRDWPTPF